MPIKNNIEKILVAPLDWGMGHATRCIPVVNALLYNGYKVIMAASPKQKIFLQAEFPQMEFIELKGYDINYSRQRWLFAVKLLTQVPKVLRTIKHEHQWLNKIIDEHQIDLVISDNRFGLYTKKCPCVFISHQLNVKAPFSWIEYVLRKLNYIYFNRFTTCWIPDVATDKNISGILSHPKNLPQIPVHYIGLLSRFNKDDNVPKKYDYCFVLSGPEPQRTILEKIILNDIDKISAAILLVRGLPSSKEFISSSPHVTIINHLPGNELQHAFMQSEYIISRSGYTTVMEILSLQKKSILIPTPGQTEQEYLSEILQQQQLCLSVPQHQFQLEQVIDRARSFSYSTISLTLFDHEKLKWLLSQNELNR